MTLSRGHYFIWGVGLLGGSLALDLKKRGHRVSGVVRSEKSRGSLEKTDFENIFLTQEPELFEALQEADGLILGTPIDSIFGILTELAAHKLNRRFWITDMASTKSELMNYVEESDHDFLLIGSHPMAGSDATGPENAREHLFKGATIYMTPSEQIEKRFNSGEYSRAYEKIKAFWEELGAHPHRVSHHEHDKWAAYLSHGLHLVSCMVSHMLKDIPEVFAVPHNPAGGSFRDITRVAGSNPELWDGIIRSNSSEVKNYLGRLDDLVREWRRSMDADELPVKEIFEQSADIRKRVIKDR